MSNLFLILSFRVYSTTLSTFDIHFNHENGFWDNRVHYFARPLACQIFVAGQSKFLRCYLILA